MCMRRWLCEQRLERMECRLLIRAAVVSVVCVAGSVSSDWIVWGAACSSEQWLPTCMRRWLCEQRLERMECRLLIRAAAVSVICVTGFASSDWSVWGAVCSSEQRLSVLYASLAL